MNSHRPIALRPTIGPTAPIAFGVVLAHILALWTLQHGLHRHHVNVVLPVPILAAFIASAAAEHVAPLPHASNPAPSTHAYTTPKPRTAPAVALTQTHAVDAATEPAAPPNATPSVVATREVAATRTSNTTGHATPPSAPAMAAPEQLELPSSNADYLQNPKPAYPAISKRLGEQGQVVHRVSIGADGLAQSAQLVQSSGYARLDLAAYTAVMRWRYLPGKRNGLPVAMAFNVPINWVLE